MAQFHDIIWEPRRGMLLLLPLTKKDFVFIQRLSSNNAIIPVNINSWLSFSNAGILCQMPSNQSQLAKSCILCKQCQQWWSCNQESAPSLQHRIYNSLQLNSSHFPQLQPSSNKVFMFRPQLMNPLQGTSNKWKKICSH